MHMHMHYAHAVFERGSGVVSYDAVSTSRMPMRMHMRMPMPR